MFSKNAKRPTKAEAARMARLKEMGCIVCFGNGGKNWPPAEVHHLLSGNKRRGHAFTIPLCPWHHRGDHTGFGSKFLTATLGPSLARQSKRFHETYGDDDSLLAKTNALLEIYHASGN